MLALFAAFGACTPEAIEVDPPGIAGAAGEDPGPGSGATATAGGKAGGDSAGGGGAGGGGAGGGSGGASNCASISAPKPECTTCIPMMCATQAKACEGTSCTCGDYAGYKGQINCLLACPTLSPMMTAATDCASKCGFDNLGPIDSPLHQLFDCLVNPPKGPPLCGECFPVH